MATISPTTFDPLRRFVRVRLQQGVPIVDADVNEREDIQKFELRAFLKWFVGDGVPEGNDGFKIVGTGLPNDFEIRAGFDGAPDALHSIGRCLVQGLDVMIEQTLQYTAQPLHASHGAPATELAARLKGPVIGTLESIVAPVILVYLDVWERNVLPAEDPSLVFAGLGTESCARSKREWVVRARAGTTLPQTGDSDFHPEHAYASLATVERRTGDPLVQPGDVTDRRERRLLLPPASLVEDVLGTDPAEYRRGRGRPPISLREAINALLRGELPATPDTPVAASPAAQVPGRAFLTDGSGGLVAIWSGEQAGGQDQIFATRMNLADIHDGFATPPQQITTGGSHVNPHAVLLPSGDLLVAYQSGTASTADVVMKRAPLGALSSADTTEIPVAATASVGEAAPFLMLTGGLVTVFYRLSTTNHWQYRRWRHTTNDWLDAAAGQLSAATAPAPDFHAAVDPTGQVWAAFRTGADVQALQFNPTTGAVTHEETFDSGATDQGPFVLCTRGGDVWVYWSSASTLHARRFRGNAWEPTETIPARTDGAFNPCAVEDSDGAIWLFWSRGDIGSADIAAMRRDPVSEGWGPLRQLTTSAGDDSAPFALVAPDNAIWIFWASDRSGVTNVYSKRLVTAV